MPKNEEDYCEKCGFLLSLHGNGCAEEEAELNPDDYIQPPKRRESDEETEDERHQ